MNHPDNILDFSNDSISIQDNSKRSALLIKVMIAFGITIILIGTYEFLEYNFWSSHYDEIGYGEELELDENLAVTAIGIIILYLGFYITNIVVFIQWFRRGYNNLHELGVKGLSHKENMAAWSFFIPFFNLYAPYNIARETLTKTIQQIRKVDPNYNEPEATGKVRAWWVLFLVSGFVSRIANRVTRDADTIEDFMLSNQVNIASSVLDLISVFFAITFIKHMSKHQDKLYEVVKYAKPESTASSETDEN